HVLPALVIDERFHGDKRTAGRKRIVGGPDKLRFSLQIPIMQNHSHRDDIGLREWVSKKIARGRFDALRQVGGGDVLPRDRLDRRQVKAHALETGMLPRYFYRKQSGGTANIAKG